jgi:hypothetical protein
MTPPSSTEFPSFEIAVQQAIDSMRQAETCFREWRSQERDRDVEHMLLHLIALIELAEQRGRHLQAVKDSEGIDSLDVDLPAVLKDAYDALVAHLPDAGDLVAHQFVLEVGAVYRGLVHHGNRH